MKIFDHFEISFGWVEIWKLISRFKKGLIETAASRTTFWTNFQTKYFLSKFDLFLNGHTKIISIRWVIKTDKFLKAVKFVIQKLFSGTIKIFKSNCDLKLWVFHSPDKVLKFLQNFMNFSNSFCKVDFWKSIFKIKKSCHLNRQVVKDSYRAFPGKFFSPVNGPKILLQPTKFWTKYFKNLESKFADK